MCYRATKYTSVVHGEKFIKSCRKYTLLEKVHTVRRVEHIADDQDRQTKGLVAAEPKWIYQLLQSDKVQNCRVRREIY